VKWWYEYLTQYTFTVKNHLPINLLRI
jgi:hypothetical protein